MVRELEKTKRQTEEKCKAEILDEMKKLQQKHKEAISQTKKKQWVGISTRLSKKIGLFYLMLT